VEAETAVDALPQPDPDQLVGKGRGVSTGDLHDAAIRDEAVGEVRSDPRETEAPEADARDGHVAG
jgi:hypothetical protein